MKRPGEFELPEGRPPEPSAPRSDSGGIRSPEQELFFRGKQVLGRKAGGLITRAVKARGGLIPLVRAMIETASTKQDAA